MGLFLCDFGEVGLWIKNLIRDCWEPIEREVIGVVMGTMNEPGLILIWWDNYGSFCEKM